jgi:hypothetical protein
LVVGEGGMEKEAHTASQSTVQMDLPRHLPPTHPVSMQNAKRNAAANTTQRSEDIAAHHVGLEEGLAEAVEVGGAGAGHHEILFGGGWGGDTCVCVCVLLGGV